MLYRLNVEANPGDDLVRLLMAAQANDLLLKVQQVNTGVFYIDLLCVSVPPIVSALYRWGYFENLSQAEVDEEVAKIKRIN